MTNEIRVQLVASPTADDEQVDELTSRLRRELLELDVEAVRRPRTDVAPEGTRAAEAVETGALIVALVTSPTLITALVETVRAWISRSTAKSVRLEMDGDAIELANASDADQQRLIDAWIDRHARR
jgi:hypothetical protein